MTDYTDLWTGPMIIREDAHDSVSELSSENDECYFFDENGEAIGQVYMFDYYNENVIVPPKSQNKELMKNIEATASCVGRIFAVYKSQDLFNPQKRIYSGTGFAVSPRMVLTAQHVVKAIHQDKETGKSYHFQTAYFCPRVNAERRVITSQLTNSNVAVELGLPDKWVDGQEGHKIQMKLDVDLFWSTVNDFAFLRSKGDHHFQKYLLPKIPRTTTGQSETFCFVVGYPGTIDMSKFVDYLKDHPVYQDQEKVKEMYSRVCRLTYDYEKKTLSVATTFKYQEQQFIRHMCPTLRGTSGGLFMTVEDMDETGQLLFFTGVHVGGSVKMHNNYAVSVMRPEFALEYTKQVLHEDREFFEKHKDILQSYLEHHKDHVKKHFDDLL